MRTTRPFPLLASALVVLLMALAPAGCAGDSASSSPSEPWGSNTIDAAALAKEISSADKPVVVCTAPPFMYRAGHIPGAILHGPATEPSGLNSLTNWAQAQPRSANIVIYCGCCPMEHCPNLRPAYKTLASMGFTRVRVLVLPNNFGIDWMNRGYPTEK